MHMWWYQAKLKVNVVILKNTLALAEIHHSKNIFFGGNAALNLRMRRAISDTWIFFFKNGKSLIKLLIEIQQNHANVKSTQEGKCKSHVSENAPKAGTMF